MSDSAKEIIKSVNPKFENVFKRKECVRDLKYIYSDDTEFENDKIYQSSTFNGATYEINVNGKARTMGFNHFERIN